MQCHRSGPHILYFIHFIHIHTHIYTPFYMYTYPILYIYTYISLTYKYINISIYLYILFYIYLTHILIHIPLYILIPPYSFIPHTFYSLPSSHQSPNIQLSSSTSSSQSLYLISQPSNSRRIIYHSSTFSFFIARCQFFTNAQFSFHFF